MTRVLAVDPGPTESAWIQYDTEAGPEKFAFANNLSVRLLVGRRLCDELVIEQVQHYGTGMAVGASVFDTCIQIGRFWEAWGRDPVLITRPTIKAQLCGSARAKDSEVRQALIDRFGGKEKGIGLKKTPGPLYGIKKHVWSALAVAVCWSEQNAH